MPRIATLKNGAVIYIHADDHTPPHFHVWSADTDVLIRIDNLQIMAGHAKKADLIEALQWAAENPTLLTEKWREYNERD
jgi:hypothetical protein